MFASWNPRAVGLDLTARQTIETGAEAGFDAVDLLVRDLLDSGANPSELRLRMEDLAIRGGAWPLPVRWRESQERFEADLKALPACARAAAVLGLRATGTWVLPAVLHGPETLDHPARSAPTLKFHRDRLGRIASILADHGLVLGLEIMGPQTSRAGTLGPFVTSYRELGTVLGELREGHANVGLLVDAFHLFAAGENPEAGFIWGADAVVWVHLAEPVVADRSRLRDQERELPVPGGLARSDELLGLLSERGFVGPVTAEPLARCQSLQGVDAQTAAALTLASLRSVWPAR